MMVLKSVLDNKLFKEQHCKMFAFEQFILNTNLDPEEVVARQLQLADREDTVDLIQFIEDNAQRLADMTPNHLKSNSAGANN